VVNSRIVCSSYRFPVSTMVFASDSRTNLQRYKTLRFSRVYWVRECSRAVTLSFSISFDEQLYASRSRAFASVFFTRSAARPRRRVAGSKPQGARRCNRAAEVRVRIPGAKFQRFAAVVTAPKTSGIAGSPLWFPDLDDGRVAVLPDISRARARPLARGGLSTKARSRSASRAEQTRLTSISELRQPAQAPGRRIASHFKLRALGLLPAPSASYGRAALSVPYALRTRSPARLRQTSRLIAGHEVARSFDP